MSTALTVNGAVYTFPSTSESNWGSNVSSWASAITTSTLQKSGGTFTLTADANFGATYGLVAAYFTSRTSNAATSGAFRLARADTVSWRNQANGANLPLGPSSSNVLQFNSIDLVDISSTQTITNKTHQNLKDSTRAYAKATRSTSQTINHNSATVVGFNTTVHDTRSGISGTDTTWKYTVQTGHDGIYLVSASVALTGNASVAGTVLLSLYKNDVLSTTLGYREVAGVSDTQYVNGSTLISLVATDYITVKITQIQASGSATRSVNANAADNHIEIIRLVTDL